MSNHTKEIKENTPINTIEIEVIAREVELKDEAGKVTNSFYAYKAVEKNGKLVDLKFTKEVTTTPKKSCIIVVDLSKINLDTSRKYPCYWVSDIVEIKEIPTRQVDEKVLENFIQPKKK